MGIADMTPDELRELALSKERSERDLRDRYIPGNSDERAPLPRPWVKKVEFEGEEFPVDMRRLRSREFIGRVAALQDEGEDATLSDQIALMEAAFDGECGKAVEASVERRLGYVDYAEVLRVEGELLALVDAKN